MDPLTDVLRVLRLTGTVYFRAEFRAPWGMDIAGGRYASFHAVAAGRCWVVPGGRAGTRGAARRPEPRLLEAGDVIAFPQRGAHSLLCEPDAAAVPAPALLGRERRDPAGRVTFGGDGAPTTLVCGHFELDLEARHPLVRSLPEVIHVRGRGSETAGWLGTLARLTLEESGSARPGAAAVADRMAEVMLLGLIRHHVEATAPTGGFLAAVSEPRVAAALVALHRDPARGWDLRSLARVAGASRTVLAERFRATVGMGAMEYLAGWRMQKARERLATTDLGIASIAEEVGYRSEWAFARAFKRRFGQTPGAFRRESRPRA